MHIRPLKNPFPQSGGLRKPKARECQDRRAAAKTPIFPVRNGGRMVYSSGMRILVLLALLLLPPTISLAENQSPESWRLLADSTSASHDNQYIEAFGNVVLDRGMDYIRADYARYYHSTNWVYLRGNIQAKFQGDYLKAEEAEFDLNSHAGWLKNGQVFMDGPHMYFEGAILKKTGPNTYEFREATVTACDGERPAWSIKTSRGDITIDGYAHLWAPRFQILDQPVLFSPYAVIPVKTKRQSGFLLPEIGHSEHLGLIYEQPYYQVIDEEQDATLFANLMTGKGLMLGAEYRLAPDIHTKGVWRLDYLFDQQTEGTSLYEDNDHMKRENRHRWWARGKFDGFLADPAWSVKMDLDLVSDQDYLREFSKGYSGFRKTRREFLQHFGRDLEDNDNELRLNRFLLTRNWSNAGFQGLVEYTQNLEYGSNNKLPGRRRSNDPTLQRLPELNLHLYQMNLPSTPLTLEGSSQFAAFWREYGTTGSRFDVHPMLGLPLHSAYGSLIPKLGFRWTGYVVERYENEHPDVDPDNSMPSRFLPEFTATGYTEFSRVFAMAGEDSLTPGSGSSLLALRHAVQPRLEYEYIPYSDQDRYPYFDELDRIRPRNELRYSLTNVFTAKRGQLLPDPDQRGETALKIDYGELARLRLEQGYDFREATRRDMENVYPRRPFTDVLADLTATLTPWLALSNKTWFSPYEGKVTEHEHSLFTVWENRAYANFGLTFLKEIDEYKRQVQKRQNIAFFGGGIVLSPQWSAAAVYRTDWEAHADLEKTLSLRYDHQCFSAETSWSRTDTDTRVEFRLNLAQIGSVGR